MQAMHCGNEQICDVDWHLSIITHASDNTVNNMTFLTEVIGLMGGGVVVETYKLFYVYT